MPTLYDHPRYYDILFGWDRDAEAASYDAILRERAGPPPRRVLELGAGSGQLAVRLARLGWEVGALDWSAAMLAYAEGAAAEAGVAMHPIQADMRSFTVAEPFDAAVCALGTLAMLPGPAAVTAHLRATAAALAPGAPYVVDLTLSAEAGAPGEPGESWEMSRGGVEVRATPSGVRVIDPALSTPLDLGWGPPLHDYDASALQALVDASAFRVAGHHPEAGRGGEDDASTFAVECRAGLPVEGRALIVLERRPT
jgi:SAM-dependent methyltransferase